MPKNKFLIIPTLLFTIWMSQPSEAALFAESLNTILPFGATVGAPPTPIPAIPEWYQDFAAPGYGVGPNAGGLKIEFCNDGTAFCGMTDIPGGEGFWYAADADLSASIITGGLAQLRLNLEATSDPTLPNFSRVRIRIDVPAPGTYTITHPYGTQAFNVATVGPGADINATTDLLPPFLATTPIGPYLFWDSGLPLTDPVTGGFYIGDATAPHKVLGSPTGNNFFRIEGPAGVDLNADPAITSNILETNLFIVLGKVFTGDGNNAPALVNDQDAALGLPYPTNPSMPIEIDVLANDQFVDIPINPTSLTISTAPAANAGTAQVVLVDGQKKIRFTPAASFTGAVSFAYTASTFGGRAAPAPATVNVFVEDLTLESAIFRPKLMKWSISGTSSDTAGNTISIHSGADMSGPVIGTATVQTDGSWKFVGKSMISPGRSDKLSIVSSNGLSVTNVDIQQR